MYVRCRNHVNTAIRLIVKQLSKILGQNGQILIPWKQSTTKKSNPHFLRNKIANTLPIQSSKTYYKCFVIVAVAHGIFFSSVISSQNSWTYGLQQTLDVQVGPKKLPVFVNFHLLAPCYSYGTTWIHLADAGDFIGTDCIRSVLSLFFVSFTFKALHRHTVKFFSEHTYLDISV